VKKTALTKAGRMLLHRLQEHGVLDDLTLQTIGEVLGVNRSTILRDPRELDQVQAEYQRLMARQPWIRRELTTADFAQEIDASADTVRAMIRDGLIEARKDGNRWMIPVREVERFTND
jgi:excisionase family DNA binding protein